jgi:NADPH:quinone reductase-like Zn-dependent oxidoreductase
MTSQTVFRLTSRNGFEGLQPFQEPIPKAGDYEVIVKVRSVALNFRDIAIATSQYPLHVKDNVIPGSDMAGEVVQVGNLVAGLAIGDCVVSPLDPTLLYGTATTTANSFGGPVDGFLREYIALPAHILIKLPKTSHKFEQWAAMVGTGSSVWNSFYGNTPLKPGETVLLLGMFGSIPRRSISANLK